MSEEVLTQQPPEVPTKRLGARIPRNDPRTLHFARFAAPPTAPKTWDPWKKRVRFPARSYGNRSFGCCTRASQANFASRLERVEARQTAKFTEEEVLRVYFEMTWREYGGGADGSPMPPDWASPGGPGDVGAYELDALRAWRRPEQTFKDTKGRPHTVDAFLKVNHSDLEEVRAACSISGKWGLKVDIALPLTWRSTDPPDLWDVPRTSDGRPAPLTGDAEPGSWGFHSMYLTAYHGVAPTSNATLDQTWYDGDVPHETPLTWDAFAAYITEAYWIIDSVDPWRKRTPPRLAASVDLLGVAKAIKKVSTQPMASQA